MNKYYSYDEAKKIVKSYNIKTGREFKDWHTKTKPKHIPYHPERAYKAEWTNIYDFLGISEKESKKYLSDKKREKWLSYDEAKKIVIKLKLKSNKEWKTFYKTNSISNIPSTPNKVYKGDGWISWADFLGTNNVYAGNFLPFNEAHSFILKQNIFVKDKLWNCWNDWSKSGSRPANIPANPNKVYRNDGWISMLHWLTGEIDVEYLPFNEAKKYVHTLNIKNQKGCLS